ncbi:MAG TPA: carbohydrate-binding protein [Chryseolinea sp.]|nr:carbohydrate-binding protein [Chryseolinea sp.]
MKKFLLRYLIIPFLFSCLLVISTPLKVSAQYLHVDGKKIVDKNGSEVILRGMGLGGWMLQEGYMLETNAFANPQHEIRAKIKELIGETDTQEFYDAWLANHCTRRDVDSLASWGFNSIRLPMHYNLYTLPIEQEPVAGENTWLDKGFAMTDSLLKWCEANHMYLILDLHAAPGGQGHDAAISDYDATKPSLWESEANKQKTIALWKKLAERYATKEWIGAYDLINEPNWNFVAGQNANGCDETGNAPLRKLYVDITAAIRSVDPNHIIFIEGNCWGNRYNGIFPKWDNNMGASFHKYWNYNDQGSVQFAIDMRDQQNLPVWLGESGENSNTWFTNAIKLVETNKIGWAWWPMKKVASVVNPLTIVKNADYTTLTNYWTNGGTKPSAAFAKNAMMQLAENTKIENTIYRKDVIDAMFRQVQETTTIPFKTNKVPGTIHFSDYDLGRNGKAYSDTDTANYRVTTGTYAAWNNGWAYRNDGVDIQASSDTDPSSNHFNVGWTQDGEWLLYTLDVDSSAVYDVIIRYAASNSNSKIILNLNDANISASSTLNSTGGNQIWGNKTISDVVLYKGKQKLKVILEKGGANLGNISFSLKKKLNEVSFTALSSETSNAGNIIYLSVNKKTDASTLTSATGFSSQVNGEERTIGSVEVDEANTSRIIIQIDQEVFDNDIITISYNSDLVKSTDETLLEDFANLPVKNNLPFHFAIPTKIEAEAFVVNQGLQLEATTDTGGGQNVGYTNVGDYLEYRIRVSEDGEYPMEARIACNATAGIIEVEQRSETGEILNSVIINVPVTGGWQAWQTVKVKMNLTAGRGILQVKILQPEFNINWFRFLAADIISGVEDNRQGVLNIYPNPADQYLTIELPENIQHQEKSFVIRSVNGTTVRKNNLLTREPFATIPIGDLSAGMYIVELKDHDKVWRSKFIKLK